MREEIETNKRRFLRALRRGDASAVAEIYLEDATLVTPTGDVIRGRAAIERFWRSGLEVGLHGAELDIALRELGVKCPTTSGPVFTATYEIDGSASTGAFSGARGSGTDTVDITTHIVTLSGELKLA